MLWSMVICGFLPEIFLGNLASEMITNTSYRDGKEIMQLYIHALSSDDKEAKVPTPLSAATSFH